MNPIFHGRQCVRISSEMLIDLHNHATPCSADSSVGVETLAREAATLGIDGFVLTDHGEGSDFKNAESIARAYGLCFIGGREIVCELGHALVLCTDHSWLRELPERCELPLPPRPHGARAPVAVVWAHPAGWRVAGTVIAPNPTLPAARYVHAIEILNGARLWQVGGVAAAELLRETLEVGSTGGSDSHVSGAIGRCLTRAAGASDAAGVIEAIIEGRTTAELGSGWTAVNDHAYERADLVPYIERVVDSLDLEERM
ncbi:MAG: PHP-associated domain-containing protein [Actinomycetota bacterium]